MESVLKYRQVPLRRLWLSLGITSAGMCIEIIGGLLTGSLALLSDAGHMFTHVFALGISAIALRLVQSRPCHHRTFGLLRAEVLAAYTNAIFLFGVTVVIGYEAILRLLHPSDVMTREMLIVAVIGLVVNAASILLLRGNGHNISVRSALVHMMADTVSSVAIVIGAVIIASTGWRWIDPLLSIGIACVITAWAWSLLRDTSRILLDIAPVGVTTDKVEQYIKEHFRQVHSMRRVHIWSISDDITVLTAEVLVMECESTTDYPMIREAISKQLHEQFGFHEITLQLEKVGLA